MDNDETETPTNEVAQPDPHFQAAFDEEQAMLQQVVLQAQVQHLMNRVVQVGAENRRLKEQFAAE